MLKFRSSVVDPQGFTWDLGGHVVFSHFGEFTTCSARGDGRRGLGARASLLHPFGDRWVPYPFQNNLRHLEPISWSSASSA